MKDIPKKQKKSKKRGAALKAKVKKRVEKQLKKHPFTFEVVDVIDPIAEVRLSLKEANAKFRKRVRKHFNL